MLKRIKSLLKATFPNFMIGFRHNLWKRRKIKEWKSSGSPIPPPDIVKQAHILTFKKRFKINILIETGTYLGDMIYAQRFNFKKIYSIELGIELFEKAKQRFIDAKHIKIFQGDSGKVLPKIMSEINEPVVFWLDGHYSGGITALGEKACPIYEEIDAIFDFSVLNHVILIDDARDFNGLNDYPTIAELSEYILSKNKKYTIEIKDDIICCYV